MARFRRVLLFAGSFFLLGTIIYGALDILRYVPAPKDSSAFGKVDIEKPETAPPLLPVRIAVPSIRLDEEVVPVGVRTDGTMATAGFRSVSWYAHGPIPGSPGNAVFAGHLDDGLGLPAVFSRLNRIEIGDTVVVYDAEGNALAFEVYDKRIYRAGEASLSDIMGDRRASGIALITCRGSWIREEKQYEERLVVFAR